LFAIRDAFAALLNKPDEAALEGALRDICTTLRTALPESTVDVLRISQRTISDPLLLRILALMPQFEDADLRELLGRSPQSAGASFAYFDPEPHFEVLANLDYPRVASFGVRFGSQAYFIVDYGREVRIEPTDWTEKRARDIGARLYSERSNQFSPRPFPSFLPPDRHFLRVWLTRRLAYLCAQVCHPEAAFNEATESLDPAAVLKDVLTIQDIASLTGLIATTSDPSTRNLLFFDLVDRYGFLGGAPERPPASILSSRFINVVADSLDNDLGDLRSTVREYIRSAWNRTIEGLWDGVLDANAKSARVLRITPPGEKPRAVKGDEAVSTLIHVLRNTTHGHNLKGLDFERFLIRHSGVMPSSVRELAVGLWLGLMSCPEVYWPPASRLGRISRVLAEPAPRDSTREDPQS